MTENRPALVSVGGSRIHVCTKLLTVSDFCKAGPVENTRPSPLVGRPEWSWPKVLFIAPLRRDRPAGSPDSVPMAREGNSGRRGDIRAQRAGMILRTSETTLRAAQ
jgi:hypothetical protein